MSATENIPQLVQDLQNELTTANQLLRLISIEMKKIKELTAPGNTFAVNVKQSAILIARIAELHQIDIANLPPLKRTVLNMLNQSDQHLSYEQHDSFRDSMDDSQ